MEIIQLEKEYADFFATKTELTTLIYSYQVSPDYYIYEMKLPPAFVGRRLGDIKLEKDFSLKLIAIKHYDRDEEKGYLRMELLEEVSDDFVVNATDDTIHEKILQRSFRHMAAHEITDHFDQCLYPFHRIASQTESGLEHDPHE